MIAVKTFAPVAAIIFLLSVVSTLHAQEPTPTPVPTPPPCLDGCGMVNGDSGQITIVNAEGGLVSSATELDAIRLEIIELRRFVVIIGGIFFGWLVMVYLFRTH
jgi:hypothetical protein